MKFRLKLIALVLLVAVILCASLCACNLLKRNDERYSKQITATATYGDRVSVVDVNELYTSFYRYYSYIYQYYQYGYISADQFKSYMSNLDKIFADSNESLARNAIYTLQNIERLSNIVLSNESAYNADKVAAMKAASTKGKTYNFKKMDQLEQYYIDRANEIRTILDVLGEDYSYINNAIYYANNQMKSLFDKYVDEVRSEFDALSKEEDETPENYNGIELVSKPNQLVYETSTKSLNLAGLKVIATYANGDTVVIPNKYLTITGFDSSKAKDDQEITITYGTYTQKFNVDIVEAYTDRSKEAEDEQTDSEKLAELTENNTKILDKFVFEIDEKDYLKEGLTDEEYKEASQELKIARTAMKRTVEYIKDNFRSYDYYLYVAYNEQIGSANTQQITNSVQKITQAEIMAEYEEMIEKELSAYKNSKYDKTTIENGGNSHITHKDYSNEEFGYYYVSHVLFKFDDATQAKIDEFKNEKVANDDVIAEFAKSLIGEITVWESNTEYDADAECVGEVCNCPRCANYNGEPITFDTLEKWYGLDEDFDDPCVSYEDGVRTVVCTCPACPVNKYTGVVNALEIVNALESEINEAKTLEEKVEILTNYIYKYNMDPGIFSNLKGNKLGYLMTPADISSGMVEDYENKCNELVKEGVGASGWVASSDYGVFFILVTGKVADIEDENVSKLEDTDYVKLGLNYVTNPSEKGHDGEKAVVVDENGNEITYELGSIGYYIWHELYEEAVSIELAKVQKAFFEQDLDIQYYKDAYKDLIKNIENGNA